MNLQLTPFSNSTSRTNQPRTQLFTNSTSRTNQPRMQPFTNSTLRTNQPRMQPFTNIQTNSNSSPIEKLYNQILILNQLELETEYNLKLLKKVIKFSKIYLPENTHSNNYKLLKQALSVLLAKIPKIPNINENILKNLANKLNFIINPPKLNICSELRNRERHKQLCLEDFKHNNVLQNMQNNNCKKLTFINEEHLKKFAIREPYAATMAASHMITLYNLDTEKPIWTKDPELKKTYAKIFMAGDSIIVHDIDTPDYENDTSDLYMKIIDIKNGDILHSIKIDTDQILIIGDRIFCLRWDGKVDVWDIKGKPLKEIQLKSSEIDLPKFVGSEKFLVLFDKGVFHIYNRQKKYLVTKDLKDMKVLENMNISCMHTDGNYLYFAADEKINLENKFASTFDNFFADLERAIRASHAEAHAGESSDADETSSDSYAPKNSLLCVMELENPDVINTYTPNDDSVFEISEIISHNGMVYIGLLSGDVVSLNIAKNKFKTLCSHSNGIDNLAIDGKFLYSTSSGGWDEKIEVQTNNIESKKHLVTIQLPPRSKSFFSLGKVHLIDNNIFNEFNFFTAPKDKS
jgi:hypothetical protein